VSDELENADGGGAAEGVEEVEHEPDELDGALAVIGRHLSEARAGDARARVALYGRLEELVGEVIGLVPASVRVEKGMVLFVGRLLESIGRLTTDETRLIGMVNYVFTDAPGVLQEAAAKYVIEGLREAEPGEEAERLRSVMRLIGETSRNTDAEETVRRMIQAAKDGRE
jgi:hypothetical protein